MSSLKKMSVVIADPEPASRHGLIVLFNAHQHLRVAGEAATVRGARELCVGKKPDVLLIDPGMEGGAGLALIGDLRRWSKGTVAMAFGRAVDPGTVKRALEAGARGYATRQDDETDVLKVLFALEDGKVHLSPCVLQALGEGLVNGKVYVANEVRAGLSPRERQVFTLLGEGRTTAQHAQKLGVSVKTVESHYERLKKKLGVRSMPELRKAAAVAGLE